ncbi:MAG: hypothetical protein RR273_00120 [Oscillospiraceae bacterium]
MRRIIYSCKDKIDWDAQSAFKLTNYYTDLENHRVFSYLNQYVENGAIKICTYCFDSEAVGTQDISIAINPNPEQQSDYLSLVFGIDGLGCCEKVSVPQKSSADGAQCAPIAAKEIGYHAYKANDQQGYYWCGEITLTKEFLEHTFAAQIGEKSIITLNMYKLFSGCSDYAALFEDNINDKNKRSDFMQEFVVLNY